MIPTLPRRRLVHLPDEEEELLEGIRHTPPGRQTLFSQGQVRLSADSLTPDPHPLEVVSDTSLLVSLNGFLLLDGNGHYTEPENELHALELRSELKKCLRYVDSFLRTSAAQESESSSPYSESDSALSDESESSSEMDEDVSVAELRERLRHEGLPYSGAKSVLLARLRQHMSRQRSNAVSRHCVSGDSATAVGSPVLTYAPEKVLQESAVQPLERGSQHSSSTALLSNRSSCGVVEDELESHDEQALEVQTPQSTRAETTEQSEGEVPSPAPNRSLWGTLVQAGSRLFRDVDNSTLVLPLMPCFSVLFFFHFLSIPLFFIILLIYFNSCLDYYLFCFAVFKFHKKCLFPCALCHAALLFLSRLGLIIELLLQCSNCCCASKKKKKNSKIKENRKIKYCIFVLTDSYGQSS
eukprot:gene4902-3514_t